MTRRLERHWRAGASWRQYDQYVCSQTWHRLNNSAPKKFSAPIPARRQRPESGAHVLVPKLTHFSDRVKLILNS